GVWTGVMGTGLVGVRVLAGVWTGGLGLGLVKIAALLPQWKDTEPRTRRLRAARLMANRQSMARQKLWIDKQGR
ncbi:MAG: hypothetical protein ACKOA7_01070, partial [Bacteroidota bacterium]